MPLLDEIIFYSDYDDSFIYKITFVTDSSTKIIHVGNIELSENELDAIENYMFF